MKNTQNNQFTLTEMLVVIAIIAIIAALLMPGLRNALNVVKDTTCINNHRQLCIGVLSYSGDYNGFLPYSVTSAGSKYARAYTLCAGTSNEHSYPNHYTGIGMLYAMKYTENARLLWCASEDVPSATTCSENNLGLKRFTASVPPNISIETNIWYRCGWVNEKNITEPLVRINPPNDGLLMCGLGYSEKWELLHQGRGMSLSFIDGRTEFFSFERRMPPSLWGGQYSMYAPKATLTTASNAYHNSR